MHKSHTRCSLLQATTRRALLVFGMAMGLSGCMGVAVATGNGGDTWKEEVLLQDGRKLMVEHHTERGGRHEVGQRSAITEHSINFVHPDTGKTLNWVSTYAPELGRTDLNPLAVHVSGGVAYVVAEPNLCLAYNKWGRPNPPYVIFKWADNAWQRIDMAQLPVELTTFNLMISYGNELVLANAVKPLGYVSAQTIRKGNAELTQPQFRSILREPMTSDQIIAMCGDMVPYKGRWVLRNDPVARKWIDREEQEKSKSIAN